MQREQSRVMHGQAMVEFLITLPVLLLMVFGILQFAMIYQAKSALNHAAFMGTRQGALNSGSLRSIRDGVASGLTPLFMRMDGKQTAAIQMSDVARARLISTIEIFNPNTALVEILNPTTAAFNLHNQANAEGKFVIPNDNLMYRTAAVAAGSMSIQDANLLKVKVTYCFKLVVPFVNQLIYGLHTGLVAVQNLAGVSFDLVSRQETSPNLCSNINTVYPAADQTIDSMSSTTGAMALLTQNLTASSKTAVAQSLKLDPALGWNLGGVRIPITAEAIVRMQSPFAPTPAGG
jgi:hypothetical protein